MYNNELINGIIFDDIKTNFNNTIPNNRVIRDMILENEEAISGILESVKYPNFFPDGTMVTRTVADYFNVNEETIRKVNTNSRNKDEMRKSGLEVYRGERLNQYKQKGYLTHVKNLNNVRALSVYNYKAVVNMALLLRDSEVANSIRLKINERAYKYNKL